jgi:hypothetical protein
LICVKLMADALAPMVLPWCRALVGVALNVSLGYVEKKAAEMAYVTKTYSGMPH